MKNFIVALFITICFSIGICEAKSLNYRIYTENGGMGLIENGISEGHKSYHLLGGEIIKENFMNMDNKVSFGIEGFFRGEPDEEDPELLQMGASAELKYMFNQWNNAISGYSFYPYLAVSYNHFSRDKNIKDDDSKDVFYFASAHGGAVLKWKCIYLDAGTIIPFWVNTQSGNFGIDSGIGYTNGRFNIGYRYKRIILTDHHFSSGENDIEFTFSGIEIGWRF